MITIATKRDPSSYPRERVMPGVMARLLSEDWNTMADKANASPMHVSRMERWIAKAKQANPSLNDDQAYRAAVMLKTEHYKKMGRRPSRPGASRSRHRPS